MLFIHYYYGDEIKEDKMGRPLIVKWDVRTKLNRISRREKKDKLRHVDVVGKIMMKFVSIKQNQWSNTKLKWPSLLDMQVDL
jgi:hypothetical protein